jgi:hypothetical protein
VKPTLLIGLGLTVLSAPPLALMGRELVDIAATCI